ncbi:hypothetical protein BX666DRAFT_976940 [Dichotomocladium elegans]|nr:hypothetical protein BX666DRAFT_976940 [Dichotomocladium elegans]
MTDVSDEEHPSRFGYGESTEAAAISDPIGSTSITAGQRSNFPARSPHFNSLTPEYIPKKEMTGVSDEEHPSRFGYDESTEAAAIFDSKGSTPITDNEATETGQSRSVQLMPPLSYFAPSSVMSADHRRRSPRMRYGMNTTRLATDGRGHVPISRPPTLSGTPTRLIKRKRPQIDDNDGQDENVWPKRRHH